MDSDPAYLAALRLLARRELSEAQVRQRLARRQHPPEAIDAAIERLKAERSIDDERVAGVIARTEIGARRRGRLRAQRRIEAAGIAPDLARRAAEEASGAVDADALLDAALRRRLPEGRSIPDEREHARLYRYLVGQGFEAERVAALLRRHRTS